MPDSLMSGPHVSIALLARADGAEFLAATAASVELHDRWVAPPRTHEQFDDLVDRLDEPQNLGLLARETATGELVGLINLSNIVLGRFRSANVGYFAFAGGAGRGLVTEALGLVTRYAFDVLSLHRLEAGIQPDNLRSLNLVRRAGFRYEGLTLRYLWIDEAWRDHERWAITVEDLS